MTTNPAEVGWQPRAYLWEGGWIAISRASTVFPTHAHHVVQIILSLDVPVRIHAGDGEWRTVRGVIVHPDAPHSLDPCGAVVVFLYVDPESREGRWLKSSLHGPLTTVTPEQFESSIPALQRFWERPQDASEMTELVRSLVGSFCVGPPPVHRIDERVARALDLIRQSDAAQIPLEEVAAAAFLSPSRFTHLFTKEVGLPFRRYLLWRKLTRAMLLISKGSPLAIAAHSSGFADAAHMTRTFHQMFGMNPQALLGRGELHEMPAPFQLT
jgi:AraC family transcriptional regulator